MICARRRSISLTRSVQHSLTRSPVPYSNSAISRKMRPAGTAASTRDPHRRQDGRQPRRARAAQEFELPEVVARDSILQDVPRRPQTPGTPVKQ
jgi:hypothetical protein